MIEYQRLCDELDFCCPESVGTSLLALIRSQHVPRYDYAEVMAYLGSICPPGVSVVWKRLNGWSPGDGPRYHRAVPIHMLRRAAALLRADPKLVFEVSDYEAPDPDPFLAVRRRESEQRFVIGAWDEPGFEGRPEI